MAVTFSVLESGSWVDQTARLKTGSTAFTNTVVRRDTLTLTLMASDGWSIAVGQQVKLADGATALFGGKVFARQYSCIGGVQVEYSVTCSSYERVATQRLTGYRFYDNQNAGAIVRDLNTNCLTGEGFTVAGVADGPVIPFIEFDRKTNVSQALDRICAEAPGYYWYIDPALDIKFFERTTYPAPWALTEADTSADVVVKDTDEVYCNRVTAIDSETGEWRFTLNDYDEIAARQALEGGVAYHEAVIEVTADQDAEAACTAYLDSHAAIARLPEFSVRRSGLKAGQLLSVTWPSLGIAGLYLIETVVMSDAEGEEWRYRVTLTDGSTVPDWLTAIRGGTNTGGGSSIQSRTTLQVNSDTILEAGNWDVEVDTTANSVTVTLPDAALMVGKSISVKRVSGGANACIVAAPGAQTIDGSGTVSLPDQWDGVTVTSTDGVKYIKTASAGTNISDGAEAPGNAVLASIEVLAHEIIGGVWHARLGLKYAAPSPIGTFQGVRIFEERPDAGLSARTVASESQTAGDAIASEAWAPEFISAIPYRSTELFQAIFAVPAPIESTPTRFYAPSYSSQVNNQLVSADQAGASPSITITLTPPPADISGEEYAKNVAIGIPTVTQAMVGGVMTTTVLSPFTPPAKDPRWYGVYSHIVYVDDEGNEQDNIGVYQGSPAKNWFPTPRTVQTAKVRLLSYANYGKDSVNTYIAGVTPEAEITIGIGVGSAGTEYCANPTIASVETFTRMEGGVLTRHVKVRFTMPNDPRCYGAYSRVTYTDDAGATCENWALAWESPVEHWFQEPNVVQSAAVDLVGYAVFNGKDQRNTITESTPHTTVSIGTAGGTLDLGKALLDTLKDTEFEIVGGILQMKGVDFSKGFGGFEVGSAALPKLTVAPDGVPLGWIGKDATSGYSGAWFKRVMIGGTSPADAKIVADANGNVSVLGSLLTGRLVVGGANQVDALYAYDGSNDICAWIGKYGSDYGFWGRNVWIGGSSPANAKIKGLSDGSVTITGAPLTLSDATRTLTLDTVNWIQMINSATGWKTSFANGYLYTANTGDANQNVQIYPGILSCSLAANVGIGVVTQPYITPIDSYLFVGNGTKSFRVALPNFNPVPPYTVGPTRIELDGVQVLTTRYASRPTDLATVIALLVYHGLCA